MRVQPPKREIQGLKASHDELFLRDLLAALWRRRLIVLTVGGAFMVAAGIASWLVPKKYEATLLVSPVSSSSGLGALSSAVSQLGAVSSLAGLSLSNNGGAKAEFLATLESEALTEKYIRENGLLPQLYHGKWDSLKGGWKSTDPDDVPTIWKANQYFKDKIRTLKESPRTGLVTMTITWTDPHVAAEWANGLVKLANDYLREKAIKESERNIAYLNVQLARVSAVEVRQSISSLMESEIKKEMVARGTEEYALKVVDPAVAPEKASSPQPVLWILGAFCAGILVSAGVIVMATRMTARLDSAASL
jgi:capsular polysaccharide biosynthesis protein